MPVAGVSVTVKGKIKVLPLMPMVNLASMLIKEMYWFLPPLDLILTKQRSIIIVQ
jgi:hypothetical protein